MKIAVDYDDVLVPFFASFFDWYNQREGTDISALHHRAYSPVESFGRDVQHWTDCMNEYHRSGLSSKLTPMERSLEVLEMLSKNHEVVILTSRPSMHREHLEAWIAEYAEGIISELHMFEGLDQHKPTTGHDKGRACLEIGAELLIDDNHTYIQSALNSGIEGILFGPHAWNESHREAYTHASNWDEVFQLVEHQR